MSIIKGTNQIVAGFGGTKRPLGEVYFSQSSLATDNPGALPGWTGEYYENGKTLFPDLYNFVKAHSELQVTKAQYDSAFTFIYSKRSGTPAAAMEEQVPEDIVKARFQRLLERVQQIATSKAGESVGKVEDVRVEEVNEQDASLVTGRTSRNYVVHFPGDASLIGKIVPVKLMESKGFYYLGKGMM